ncbi:TPR-like protein [Sanghuangporus baumii]|uniref:TPR-like protein n=1 Tax=Sanghuangporus baumii TaxID=108892 RepID=A0A9Q5I488_SANBA|nr:TPR-like protein [Sanghuangporus baumii]
MLQAESSWSSFEESGNREDLDQAITFQQTALDDCPDSDSDRAETLFGLALFLYTRYERWGDIDALEKSIKLDRDALALRPVGHPLRASSLGNLATSLSTRFNQNGGMQDLEDAIALQRSALELRPEGHPDRSMSLGNLAGSLSTRFNQNGGMQDLEDAIALERSALELRPEGHPDRASSLGNLATSLSKRFDQNGGMQDLEDAIALERSALELRPEGHPVRASSLGNLATSLSTRFNQNGGMQDLEDAIALERSALELRPEGHPHRSMSLKNLAEYLCLRFGREGNVNDFNQSIQLLDHATSHAFSSFSHRLKAVRRWTTIARSHDHPTLLEAHKTSISLLQRALSTRPTLSTQHQFLSSDGGYQALALDAASCAIAKGNFALAIEFLEQGRALLWSQMRGLRTPLEQLSQASKPLADRFEDCSRRLEALMASSESRQVGSDIGEGGMQANSARQASADAMFVQIRKLTEEQEVIINAIRELPEFEDFLRAAPFESLKEAASEGPVIVLNHSSFRCDALIITSSQETPCVCIPLDNVFYSDSIELHKELVKGRKKFGLRSKKYDGILRRVMKTLWDRVVSKVIQKLKELRVNGGSRIWWCATSVLSAFPFHAAGPYEGADGRMKYLLDDYVSSYIPTLASLIHARYGVQNGSEKMLFVADTTLPSAKKERDWICRSRRRLIDKQLLDDHATPEEVLRLLPWAQWVHFTCHGQLGKEPFNSSLKLPGGKLTLLDIARANLPNAEFAFLSACHTAEQGPKFALDEALHLAAAMQFCGFRSVVGTMWKLLDRDGPFLARFVYGHMMLDLEEGEVRFKRAAEAVRGAALSLRDQGDEGPDGYKVDIMAERWVNLVHIGA